MFVIWLFCLAILTAVSGEVVDVLICHAVQGQNALWSDIQTKLSSTGLFRKVDALDCGSQTPSITTLLVRMFDLTFNYFSSSTFITGISIGFGFLACAIQRFDGARRQFRRFCRCRRQQDARRRAWCYNQRIGCRWSIPIEFLFADFDRYRACGWLFCVGAVARIDTAVEWCQPISRLFARIVIFACLPIFFMVPDNDSFS